MPEEPTPALELAPAGIYLRLMFLRRVKPHWPAVAILALAALLRLWALDVKPAHFDEGVNGWFADQMTRTGYYRYDPTNYHGPLHMVAVFVSQTLLGRNLWSLRLPAVLASLLAVWALLKCGRFFGQRTARLAALAMAVSPAYVFYGRYSIHESWMAFFLILVLLGILGLWKNGDRQSLWTLALGATGTVLTKETYVIHAACFALAVPVLFLWQKVLPSKPPNPPSPQRWTRRDAGFAVAASVFVIAAFYSGFFLDFGALRGLYETFAAWFQTGVHAAGHEKTAYQFGPVNVYWVAIMARYEWASLAGLIACFYFVTPTDARLRYLAIYGGGALFAFSLIPYKTPWCGVSIFWPFYLLAASASAALPAAIRRGLWVVLIASGLIISVRLNFFRFADDSEPYVYVQTYPEIDVAIGPPLRKAAADPAFYHAKGAVILESYYPLPWILGDFTRIGYHAKNAVPENITSSFVITSGDAADAVQANLSGNYYRKKFRLRSGVDDCVVFFRADDFAEMLGGRPDVIGSAPGGQP